MEGPPAAPKLLRDHGNRRRARASGSRVLTAVSRFACAVTHWCLLFAAALANLYLSPSPFRSPIVKAILIVQVLYLTSAELYVGLHTLRISSLPPIALQQLSPSIGAGSPDQDYRQVAQPTVTTHHVFVVKVSGASFV